MFFPILTINFFFFCFWEKDKHVDKKYEAGATSVMNWIQESIAKYFITFLD